VAPIILSLGWLTSLESHSNPRQSLRAALEDRSRCATDYTLAQAHTFCVLFSRGMIQVFVGRAYPILTDRRSANEPVSLAPATFGNWTVR
jgi:hypothetical protein